MAEDWQMKPVSTLIIFVMIDQLNSWVACIAGVIREGTGFFLSPFLALPVSPRLHLLCRLTLSHRGRVLTDLLKVKMHVEC